MSTSPSFADPPADPSADPPADPVADPPVGAVAHASAGVADLADAQQRSLWQAAVEAQSHAYAPYSKFAVGAAVLDEHGRIHAGCNVENAAYPQGICAEASALTAMVLAGGREAKALVVVGDGDGLVTPCGGCRQKLREFATPETPVLVADRNRVRATFTLEQLLPSSFGPENLAP